MGLNEGDGDHFFTKAYTKFTSDSEKAHVGVRCSSSFVMDCIDQENILLKITLVKYTGKSDVNTHVKVQ